MGGGRAGAQAGDRASLKGTGGGKRRWLELMGDGHRRQQAAGLSDAEAVGGGRQRHECGSGVWW
jgi:hypothetical protein